MNNSESTPPRLQGIVPALVTPYRSDGSVHTNSIKRIVERNLSQGASGFYVCGSTGEAFLLSEGERKFVLETVVEAVAGRAAVIAHVGNIATDMAISLARHARSVGVSAIFSIPPFYYNFTFEELKAYYLDLIDAAGLPMLVYNFPAFSGVALTAQNARDLLSNPLVAGVKHTSMDLYQLERIKRIREDIVVFIGHDEVFLAGLSMGADGAIGSTFNVITGMFVRIMQLFQAGMREEAADLQQQVNSFIEVLISVGVFNGIKVILESEGIEVGTCRRPFLPLGPEARERAISAYQRLVG